MVTEEGKKEQNSDKEPQGSIAEVGGCQKRTSYAGARTSVLNTELLAERHALWASACCLFCS